MEFEIENEKDDKKSDLLDSNLYIIGKIDQKMTYNFLTELFALVEEFKERDVENPEICIIISTEGGFLTEMYSILDAIEYVKSQGFDICIMGFGKVMSAGIPILAAGSKNKRKLGKNTKLMLHQISGECSGIMSTMETEFIERKKEQESYLDCLVSLTDKKKPFFKKLMNKKADFYFGPEEAIKYGIADEIL